MTQDPVEPHGQSPGHPTTRPAWGDIPACLPAHPAGGPEAGAGRPPTRSLEQTRGAPHASSCEATRWGADGGIAARYAQALFETAKAEGRIDEALDHLTSLGEALRREPDLRGFLRNPDVDPEDKVGLLDRVMGGRWPELVRAFIRMVTALGRPELLADIAAAFASMADEDRGLVRVVVRSARPLAEQTLSRLRATLQRREGKTVELRVELAPELLGGLQVRLDHRVIDGSVQRQLSELRQQLMSTRVH